MTHTIVSVAQEVMCVVVPGSLAGRWTKIVYGLGDTRYVDILGHQSFVVRQITLCLRQLLFENSNASEGAGKVWRQA